MNTKSLLLFTLSLLVFPLLISFGSQQNQPEVKEHNSFTSTDRHNNVPDKPWDWNMALPDKSGVKHDQQGHDDDGKCHHFHFDRLTGRRNKLVFCLLGKLILLAAHLSSLLIGYIQYMH
jgi:hypothetical protein